MSDSGDSFGDVLASPPGVVFACLVGMTLLCCVAQVVFGSVSKAWRAAWALVEPRTSLHDFQRRHGVRVIPAKGSSRFDLDAPATMLQWVDEAVLGAADDGAAAAASQAGKASGSVVVPLGRARGAAKRVDGELRLGETVHPETLKPVPPTQTKYLDMLHDRLLEVEEASKHYSTLRDPRGGLVVQLHKPQVSPAPITLQSDRPLKGGGRADVDSTPAYYEVEIKKLRSDAVLSLGWSTYPAPPWEPPGQRPCSIALAFARAKLGFRAAAALEVRKVDVADEIRDTDTTGENDSIALLYRSGDAPTANHQVPVPVLREGDVVGCALKVATLAMPSGESMTVLEFIWTVNGAQVRIPNNLAVYQAQFKTHTTDGDMSPLPSLGPEILANGCAHPTLSSSRAAVLRVRLEPPFTFMKNGKVIAFAPDGSRGGLRGSRSDADVHASARRTVAANLHRQSLRVARSSPGSTARSERTPPRKSPGSSPGKSPASAKSRRSQSKSLDLETRRGETKSTENERSRSEGLHTSTRVRRSVGLTESHAAKSIKRRRSAADGHGASRRGKARVSPSSHSTAARSAGGSDAEVASLGTPPRNYRVSTRRSVA